MFQYLTEHSLHYVLQQGMMEGMQAIRLQRRSNEHNGVSNRRHLDCLFKPFVQAQVNED